MGADLLIEVPAHMVTMNTTKRKHEKQPLPPSDSTRYEGHNRPLSTNPPRRFNIYIFNDGGVIFLGP